MIAVTFKQTEGIVPREEKTRYRRVIVESLSIVRNNKTVLWFVLYFAGFSPFTFVMFWFLQPYMEMSEIPIAFFGLVYAVLSLVNAGVSFFSEEYDRFSGGYTFMTLAVLTGVSMVLLGTVSSLLVLPLWGIVFGAHTFNQTLVSDRVLGLIRPDRAVTVLSFQNLVRRLVYVVVGPVIGRVGDLYGLERALQVNAAIFIAVITTVFLLRGRITKKAMPI